MKIKLDEKALRQAIQPAVQDIVRTYDRDLERLRVRYAGKPTAEIKPAIQHLFRSNGGSISDPELTNFAELISQGKRVRMQVK
jgi:hypothetical protein